MGPEPYVLLHVVRHGRTVWNTEGRLQGRTPDVPLDDVGLAQAASAARRLAGEPVSRVVSSDQVRAMQTAEAIASVHGVAVVPETALRERSFGTWEGGPVARFTTELAVDPRWCAPGGETVAAVRTRVTGFLRALLAEPPPGDVVVVGHREVVRTLLAVLDGVSSAELPTETMANAGIRSCRVPLSVAAPRRAEP